MIDASVAPALSMSRYSRWPLTDAPVERLAGAFTPGTVGCGIEVPLEIVCGSGFIAAKHDVMGVAGRLTSALRAVIAGAFQLDAAVEILAVVGPSSFSDSPRRCYR